MDRNLLLLVAPVLLFSVIAHEIAHGYAALRQGDPTAYQLGRLTWNPLKHIDPWLTILLPLILWKTTGIALGGAKPVPVNPRNYRNYRRGDIIVSLAGVATNLVVALACTLLFIPFGMLGGAVAPLRETFALLQAMMMLGVYINLQLIAFNLIPIPPLDGSHVFKYLLPPALSLRFQQIGFLGILILVLLLQTSVLDWWLWPADRLAVLLMKAVQPFQLSSQLVPWAP